MKIEDSLKQNLLSILNSLGFNDFLLNDIEVIVNKDKTHGDYSSNLALKFSKKVNKNPREFANLIVSNFKSYDIEKLEKTYSEYQKRIDKDISSTLKDCGGDGKSYTENQKKLMVWYTFFFLNRGKPSTHIEAFSKMSNAEMLASMPGVIQKIINAAEKKLRGDKL